jgi:DNA-directed RNA polymerase specialized sigma24 family protein
MSETAQLGAAGMETHEASPPVAFEAFFEQEGDGLYRALWLVTRSRFEAEELTQEAFVRVLERWDRVSEMEDPRAYLYRTAMNAFRTGYGRALLAAKRTMKVLRRRRDRRDRRARRRYSGARPSLAASARSSGLDRHARLRFRGGCPHARHPCFDAPHPRIPGARATQGDDAP